MNSMLNIFKNEIGIYLVFTLLFIQCSTEYKTEEKFEIENNSVLIKRPILVLTLFKVRPDSLLSGYQRFETNATLKSQFNSFSTSYSNHQWISAPSEIIPEKGEFFIVIPIEVRDISKLGEKSTTIFETNFYLKIKDLEIKPTIGKTPRLDPAFNYAIFGDYTAIIKTFYNWRKDLSPAVIYKPFVSFDRYLTFEITKELLKEKIVLSYKTTAQEFDVIIKKIGEDYKYYMDEYE